MVGHVVPERVGRDSFYARYPTIARKIPSGSADLCLHATRRVPGINPWPVLQHFGRDAGRKIPCSSYFRVIPGSHHVLQSGNRAKSRNRAVGSVMYPRPPPPAPRHQTVRACLPATSDPQKRTILKFGRGGSVPSRRMIRGAGDAFRRMRRLCAVHKIRYNSVKYCRTDKVRYHKRRN
jgi:hypothetical protein